MIGESGFFSAIVLGKPSLRSKNFKKWITSVVIPRFKRMDFEEETSEVEEKNRQKGQYT